ncbi:hypothetical protein GpartN1_g5567.t1 [Galdieria partita]|uniref:ETFB lysine methyltransferase n=1 Tax=Galdieria partita TaxID=83374 RepID=A0A9C7Q056_9RHOD|nr:hypothetical protein GpartN1_g5567.t1 [Galdieria partita]
MISVMLEFPHPVQVQVVSEWFMSLGACAVEVFNSKVETEYPQYTKAEELNTSLWTSCRTFRVLLPHDVSPEDFLMSLASVSKWNQIKILNKVVVEETDWVERVRDNFRPITIGRLYVRCPWHLFPEPSRGKNELVDMIIHPGMGFGTGEHATTRLCLRWLQRTIQGGEKLLDYGSGSGILCIAASQLGCELCHGVEIDLDSIRNAEENKSLNGISNISFFQPMEAPSFCYDIIIANILFHPLVDLAEKFSQCSRIGTRIALSGILYDQAEILKETYEDVGFRFEDTMIENEWCLITGTKI